MKKIITYILIFTPYFLFSQEYSDTTKLHLDSLSKNHIQNLFKGEVLMYLDLYSPNYTDIGGGTNGDGTVDFNSWEEQLKELVSSKEFEEIQGKSIEVLLDVEKQEISNYDEIVEEKGKVKRFSFELKQGDYLVLFPPKEDSDWVDGWFGIFRLENGTWKIIAGD